MSFPVKKIGLISCMMLSLCACDPLDKLLGKSEQPAAPAMRQMPVAKVTVEEIIPMEMKVKRDVVGRTVSFRKAEVRPEVGGIIRESLFEEGSQIVAGQVLYIIDPDMYQAAYDSAKAALDKAEANLNVARLKEQRTAQLRKSNSVSQQDYDDTRAAYLQAAADVASCKASLKTAEINLNRTEIKAPISGRIGKSSVSVGTLVTANQALALATIQQVDPMNVDLNMAADETFALRSYTGLVASPQSGGNDVQVRLFMNNNTVYSKLGTLRFADVGVNEGTGTVTLRAEMPNPKHELLPGLFVRAELNIGVIKDAIMVPQRAVLRDNRANPYVYVLGAEGKAERRDLELGLADGDSWQCLSGLSAGDKVIMNGLQNVRNGSPVIVISAAEAVEMNSAKVPQAAAGAK